MLLLRHDAAVAVWPWPHTLSLPAAVVASPRLARAFASVCLVVPMKNFPMIF